MAKGKVLMTDRMRTRENKQDTKEATGRMVEVREE